MLHQKMNQSNFVENLIGVLFIRRLIVKLSDSFKLPSRIIFFTHSKIIANFDELKLDNALPGIDFDPNGEIIATLDWYGTCLISDINTNDCYFNLQMNQKAGRFFT